MWMVSVTGAAKPRAAKSFLSDEAISPDSG